MDKDKLIDALYKDKLENHSYYYRRLEELIPTALAVVLSMALGLVIILVAVITQ